MGIVVRLADHARASVRSRIKLEAGIPVARSIRSATSQDTPRLPARIRDRCGSDTPTASANAFCGPSSAVTCSANRDSPSMGESLPQVNSVRQEEVYCGKIDILGKLADHPAMPRASDLKEPKLFIGEWIEVLGLKQNDIAKSSGIKKSYLNLLCKRKRDNPSLNVLSAIADAMGLTIKDLQTRPPAAASIETIREIPSALIERIRTQRKAS